MSAFATTDSIRQDFSTAMAAMYRGEVPLYGDLLEIVNAINRQTLAQQPALEQQLADADEIGRFADERHGAIRLGTASELSAMRRIFAVMGMFPVGYYNLSTAGVPVHSTAFRPIELASLAGCPFRVFTSLLMLDLIEDDELRAEASRILESRDIVTPRALELLAKAERDGGLERSDAADFVSETLETFRWHGSANVSRATYERLCASHRLVADIVSFRGPHINHLTPRTLDIDAAHAEMVRRGIDAKATIEGPPRRAVPILLRQTSFKALEENIEFQDGTPGAHTARFGEIEQRGIALTRKGRALYDACLDQARRADVPGESYEERLQFAFTLFPDDLTELRTQGLARFRYALTDRGRALAAARQVAPHGLSGWIEAGLVEAYPITYEDFLPVSAAGIFQSNLSGAEEQSYSASTCYAQFEAALGVEVFDPFKLYEALELQSIAEVGEQLDTKLQAKACA